MVVTKADVYEKVTFAERPVCPHCGKEMRIYECGQTGAVCGSRWGTPYLFVCVNDECPLFVEGWKHMRETYRRACSYRCFCYPDSRRTESMVVYSHVMPGIIDEATITGDRARGTLEDPEVQKLFDLFESRDLEGLLAGLLDEKLYYKLRLKAAELIGELGMLEAIEPLCDYKFKDQRIAARVRDNVRRIHEMNGTRECPFCAEIIDAAATTCSECGRELNPFSLQGNRTKDS